MPTGRTITVRGILGHDVALQETARRTNQGGGRSDIVSYRVHLGPAFIGELHADWVLREDRTRSTEKEFIGSYPKKKDFGPSGSRTDVLKELVRHHLCWKMEEIRKGRASLEREKEAALEALFVIQEKIREAESETDRISAALRLH
ncbi:hypothetical protein ACWD7M_16315 [Streptomyces griseus]|uniref:hypothetical protein n=1 Tax=Streptomyces sp. NPDC056454 TaxID=3345823 RepID=UPI00369402F8